MRGWQHAKEFKIYLVEKQVFILKKYNSGHRRKHRHELEGSKSNLSEAMVCFTIDNPGEL